MADTVVGSATREVVIGTGRGTSLIKTGDIVRIDGDQGTVTIVKRAA